VLIERCQVEEKSPGFVELAGTLGIIRIRRSRTGISLPVEEPDKN
jgi:hypothetical protein